jgi:PAS domain-containing protein
MCALLVRRYATQGPAGANPVDDDYQQTSPCQSQRIFAVAKRLILRGPEDRQPRREDARSTAGAPRPPAAPAPLPAGQSALPSEWLFSMAAEPVIIAEATARRIVQANPAAAQLLGLPRDQLIGRPVLEAFHVSDAEAICGGLDSAMSAEGAQAVSCRPIEAATPIRAVMSWFKADADSYFLIRLGPPAGDAGQRVGRASPVFDAIENTSVGFLLTDAEFRIEYANQAFLDLIELTDAAEVHGQPLARWLALSAADLARLRNQMLQREATSVMAVRLLTEGRTSPDVEVCAVAVPDGHALCWGFTIAELPRLN